MPLFFILVPLLVLSVFAKDWVHYSGQNEVRDAVLTDNGTLWAAFAWGLAERISNKTENIYMPGNNNLQAADFVQLYALPNGDIIAVSKNGTLVRKNKNSRNFETINASFVEIKRNVRQGLGKRAENILVLPLEGAIAFFNYEQNRSVITLSQLGTNSLEEYPIKRIAVKDNSIWVELDAAIWKREISWAEIYNDRFLADPNSWNKVNEIPFAEESKPSYTANFLNTYLKRAKEISVLGSDVIIWGVEKDDVEYDFFVRIRNNEWGSYFLANPTGYYDDQKDVFSKSLALMPDGNFASGRWGAGLLTFDNGFPKTQLKQWFHSTKNTCPTKFKNENTNGYTLVQGLTASPDFSGYLFSYVSQDNYGIGFLNGNSDSPQCIKPTEASSPYAYSIIAREKNEEWEIYVAWKNIMEAKDGGVDFYKTSSKNFSPVLQKKWSLPFGSPIDFGFDKQGILWAVSSSKIFYLDEKDDEWKEPSYIRSFNGGVISALETDAKNGLWIGILGDGAYLFSQTNNSPDSLVAKHFKTKDGLLNEVVYDIAIDTIRGKVYFAHDLGFSIYSTALVRGDYIKSSSPKTIVYPTPFRPNLHSFLTIDFISEKSSVYILDSSGKRVRIFRGNDLQGGRVVWDGKNESGKLVAPGLYHYIAADGKNTNKGKIIIER